MNKNKGDLEQSRSPIWDNICNLFQKYFKFIAIILIALLVLGMGVLSLKVTALQIDNDIHIAEKAELIQDNQDLKKETKVLQDNVIAHFIH